MPKYFVEYDFKTPQDGRYWLPLLVDAETPGAAELLASSIATEIKSHYTLIRMTAPRVYVRGLISTVIDDYVTQRMHGRVEFVNVVEWRMTAVPAIPDLSFDNHLKMVETTELMSGENVATSINSHQFPVRQYKIGETDPPEFILLNVVQQGAI